MLIILFDIKGIVHKEFALTGQSVNSAYYSEVLRRLHEIVRRLRPELWRQKNWLLHHDNAPSHISFFTRQFFTKSNVAVIPHPSYFSLFPRLKIQLKDRHFDRIDVMEAESQAVLKSLTEHDFQDSFKTWQKYWQRYIRAEGDYFEGDSGQ
jgi:hypothetical protein